MRTDLEADQASRKHSEAFCGSRPLCIPNEDGDLTLFPRGPGGPFSPEGPGEPCSRSQREWVENTEALLHHSHFCIVDLQILLVHHLLLSLPWRHRDPESRRSAAFKKDR